MTSKIKVDNINKVSDDSNIIKKCGTTTTIGSGASNPIVVDGSAITLGRCGGTVALASGATQTGFGRTGTVDWQTSSIKTATFTAANGEGYFANTSGGAFTMNLPAGSAGAIVSVVDYTNTFQTNGLTVTPNGSEKIGGIAASITLSTEGQSVTFVYVDGTEGWKNIQDSTSNVTGNPHLCATGGTITTCGNCKIHTFTGPGSFVVNGISQTAPENVVSYLVVAGGGAGACGGGSGGGGGGGGGFREFKGPHQSYSVSPLNGSTPITVTATTFPITVGAGGAEAPSAAGRVGANSVFSTITSAGGGGGGSFSAGGNGGSGGGGGGGYSPPQSPNAAGSGNTPPVSPPQGQPGGTSHTDGSNNKRNGGGGGGATGSGGNAPSGVMPSACTTANAGGNAALTSIVGSANYYSGGGGGAKGSDGPGSPSGGNGVGGRGSAGQPIQGISPMVTATGGAVNRGGGGGAVIQNGPGYNVGSTMTGGSGVVIIRYKYK